MRKRPAEVTAEMVLEKFNIGEVTSSQMIAKRLGVATPSCLKALDELVSHGILRRRLNGKTMYSDHYEPRRYYILADIIGCGRPAHRYYPLLTGKHLMDDPEFRMIAKHRELAELTRRKV